MEEMRRAITGSTFDAFARAFLEGYQPADEAARQEQREKWLASREEEG